jgi:hypothetical protein
VVVSFWVGRLDLELGNSMGKFLVGLRKELCGLQTSALIGRDANSGILSCHFVLTALYSEIVELSSESPII